MPTDEWFKENPKVSAYIPKELNEKLLDWMKGRSIKKVSQALTTILEEHLGVAQTEPTTQPVRDDRLEALEQRFENLFRIVQELREPIQASSQRVVQTELFSIEPIEETLSDDEAIALIDAKQSIDVVEEIQDDEPDEILYDFLELESQDSAQRTDEEVIKTLEPEQSSSEVEISENEGFKPVMTNAEVSQILNESINTIRSRHRSNKGFKAKGYQFTPTREGKDPRWKTEKVEDLVGSK